MTTDAHRAVTLRGAIEEADSKRQRLQDQMAGRYARLPLRYWRQQAHFTTPAADGQMARKAVEGGTAAMGRLLQRWRIEPTELADRLGADVSLVEDLLHGLAARRW